MHVQVLACVHARKVEDYVEPSVLSHQSCQKRVSNFSDQLKSDLTREKCGLLKMKQTHPIRIIQLFYFCHCGTGSVRKGCPLVSG